MYYRATITERWRRFSILNSLRIDTIKKVLDRSKKIAEVWSGDKHKSLRYV